MKLKEIIVKNNRHYQLDDSKKSLEIKTLFLGLNNIELYSDDEEEDLLKKIEKRKLPTATHYFIGSPIEISELVESYPICYFKRIKTN